MKQVDFHGRRAAQIESGELRLIVTQQGGHVAALLDKKSGISPLWIPHWPSIEPSEYSPARHPEYGEGAEAQLLAGIFGHNICLDLFGGPDEDEAAAGIPVHGEAAIAPYQMSGDERQIVLQADLPKAELTFERKVELAADGVVVFSEAIRNNSYTGRPIGWTQHVTLGAPFLQPGQTRFRVSATRSRVFEGAFNNDLGKHLAGAEFEWPFCPQKDGGVEDLSTLTQETSSGGFTAHLMDPTRSTRSFSPGRRDTSLHLATCGRGKTFPGLGDGRRIIYGPGLRGTPRRSRWVWSSAYLPWLNRAAAWWNEARCLLTPPFSGLRRKPDPRFATVPFCAVRAAAPWGAVGRRSQDCSALLSPGL